MAQKPTQPGTQPATRKRPQLTPEQKAERAQANASAFRKLVNKRVPRLLKLIGHVGNLSARGNYTYTDEQVDKIFGMIHEALRTARARFQGQKDVAVKDIL
jgi:hypothetical protein